MGQTLNQRKKKYLEKHVYICVLLEVISFWKNATDFADFKHRSFWGYSRHDSLYWLFIWFHLPSGVPKRCSYYSQGHWGAHTCSTMIRLHVRSLLNRNLVYLQVTVKRSYGWYSLIGSVTEMFGLYGSDWQEASFRDPCVKVWKVTKTHADMRLLQEEVVFSF